MTSRLVVGEWSASRPGRFIPGERATDTHWIGGWVGPQSQSGRRGEDKIPDSTGTRTPTLRPSSPVISRCTDCAIPAPHSHHVITEILMSVRIKITVLRDVAPYSLVDINISEDLAASIFPFTALPPPCLKYCSPNPAYFHLEDGNSRLLRNVGICQATRPHILQDTQPTVSRLQIRSSVEDQTIYRPA
jgi:hypothetical protein